MSTHLTSRLGSFLLHIALPSLALAALCFLNQWAFRKLFHTSYISWYVSAGPFIAIATAAFGAAWGDLDNNVGLISAHTLDYIGACLQTAGLPIYAFSGHLNSKHHEGRMPVLDLVFGLPLLIVFVLAILGWLLLIAPLQYFLFLVCGAPSRMARHSNYRLYARFLGWRLTYEEPELTDPEPKGAWDASMRSKPVTLANAFGGATLFVIGRLWS